MEEEKNILAFTVNESLLLDTGQGIDEMLAISLEPDIAIETYHEYVQIRGIIILHGEYKKSERMITSENDSVMNYIEKIIDTEPGQAMFSHRFPVEISIPKNRIFSVEDVNVEVASFDYELPTIDCLKINATLHIGGISKGEIIEELVEDEEEEEPVEEELIEGITQTVKPELADVIETPANEESFDTETEDGVDEVALIGIDEQEIEPDANVEVITEENAIDIQLSETEDPDEEKVKDVLFLTDLFGGNQEERKTSIKIHITQEDDTVETIAKRYEVSALQLMKDNNLSPEDVTEGILIEIPQK